MTDTFRVTVQKTLGKDRMFSRVEAGLSMRLALAHARILLSNSYNTRILIEREPPPPLGGKQGSL